MKKIWAEQALTAQGWRSRVCVCIDAGGKIASVTADCTPEGHRVGALLPAPANVHSHAFQRAMAGMTERQGPDPADNFWAWRGLMYRFLDQLSPDDVEAIAAFVQMEMLEAGYGSVGEFHYLHHQPDGRPYENLAEMSLRIIAAANQTGIGLTLLPVLYEQGGCDGRALGAGQVRFGSTPTQYLALHEQTRAALVALPSDARIGMAPHSLRAVKAESLAEILAVSTGIPIHMHIAEQAGEVTEMLASTGQRPVEWLFNHHQVNGAWCLIHATRMVSSEISLLAKSGAVAGLCPITEANLGDGIFAGQEFMAQGGLFGVGSDSNIRIALAEELRGLEYSQRLQHHARAVLANEVQSSGRWLFERAAKGGAQALGRQSGELAPGATADLMALDLTATNLLGKLGDGLLDSYVFACDDRVVSDVWSAGRHLVIDGQHIKHDEIRRRYHETIMALKGRL